MSTADERISLAHALGAREIIRPHLSPTPLRQYPRLARPQTSTPPLSAQRV